MCKVTPEETSHLISKSNNITQTIIEAGLGTNGKQLVPPSGGSLPEVTVSTILDIYPTLNYEETQLHAGVPKGLV